MFAAGFTSLCCMCVPLFLSHPFLASLSPNTFMTSFHSLAILFSAGTLLFLLVLAAVVVSMVLYSKFYLQHPALAQFLTLLLLFSASMMLFVTADSPFWIFVGWDGLGVVSYLLVGFYANWKSGNSGMITFLSNRAGDATLILGFSFLLLGCHFQWGTLLPLLFFLTSITKSAQVPYSSWLPEAMAAPTPISALVHSSTLVTAGAVLLFKVGASSFLVLSLTFGSCTFILASLGAVAESDFKKIIALSTLSQMGLLFMMVSSGLWFIFSSHLFVHAFLKSTLFMGVGSALHASFGGQDGRSIQTPGSFINVVFISMLISLVGLLFLGGMFTKDLLLDSPVSSLLSFVVMIGLGASFVYSSSLISCMVNGGVGGLGDSRFLFVSLLLLPLAAVCGGGFGISNFMVSPEGVGHKFIWVFLFSILLIFVVKGRLMNSAGYQNFLAAASKTGSLFSSKKALDAGGADWLAASTLRGGVHLGLSLLLGLRFPLVFSMLAFIFLLC